MPKDSLKKIFLEHKIGSSKSRSPFWCQSLKEPFEERLLGTQRRLFDSEEPSLSAKRLSQKSLLRTQNRLLEIKEPFLVSKNSLRKGSSEPKEGSSEPKEGSSIPRSLPLVRKGFLKKIFLEHKIGFSKSRSLFWCQRTF
jgi:hypothetical protein